LYFCTDGQQYSLIMVSKSWLGSEPTYLFLTLAQRLPLLRDQLGALGYMYVLEVATRLAVDGELEEVRDGSLDCTLIMNRRPGVRSLARSLGIELALQLRSCTVGQLDGFGTVGFNPPLVLGLCGFPIGVSDVVVVLRNGVSSVCS